MPKNTDKLLIDLNIILDVFLAREGFEASQGILKLGEHTHTLYISAHTVTTLAYLLENAKVPKAGINRHIDWVLKVFAVIPVDEKLLNFALKSNITDYEDAVMEQAAVSVGAARIITRNTKDFKASVVQVATPEEYLGDSQSSLLQ